MAPPIDEEERRRHQALRARHRAELTAIQAQLDNGRPETALELLGRLEHAAADLPEMTSLRAGLEKWLAARDHADRGDFGLAIQGIEKLVANAFPSRYLAVELQDLRDKQEKVTELMRAVQKAAIDGRWRDVLHLAENVLAIAPAHRTAARLRAQAWTNVDQETVASAPHERAGRPSRDRLILWVDGVGGYLLLLEPRATLGQAGPSSRCDIPLMADISRAHATIERETEGYIVEAHQPAMVNDKRVTQSPLQNGDRLTLGESCQLRFVQNVPLSNSARLEIVSGHRFGLPIDGVLMMAEAIVLGGGQVHLKLPISDRLVLFRVQDGLVLRGSQSFTVNGESVGQDFVLRPGDVVRGEDFGLALELVPSR